MSHAGSSSLGPCLGLLLAGLVAGRVHAGPTALAELPAADVPARASPGFGAGVHGAASAPESEWADLDEAAAAEPEAKPARPAAPRPAPTGRPLPAREPAPPDDAQLKATAKAARGWLRDTFPWAFSDANANADGSDGSDGAPGRASTVDVAGGDDPAAAIGHDPIAADPLRHAPTGAGPPPATGAPEAPVQWQGHAEPRDQRRAEWDGVDDPVQRAIRYVRELFEHPMTWLIVALIVLAQGGVWLLARLGNPARRRRRRHRHRHRHRHGPR